MCRSWGDSVAAGTRRAKKASCKSNHAGGQGIEVQEYNSGDIALLPRRLHNAPFASLTLGGYDSSLVEENGVVFPFATVIPGGIIVGIQAITTPSESGSSSEATSLLPSGIWAYMDATVAEIWLPQSACEMFESAFGLTYDDATDLYLVSETLHSKLKQRNPSITFTLATNLDQGETVSIKLLYNAFDLMASAPYQGLSEASYYSPLRRAMNNTQYTIGRTFFQKGEYHHRLHAESQLACCEIASLS